MYKKGLLILFKLICDDIHVEYINNIPFLFVRDRQRFILTSRQVELLEKFKNTPLEKF